MRNSETVLKNQEEVNLAQDHTFRNSVMEYEWVE